MLISVVIPTRNRPDLLLRAVNSVVQQSHQDLEVLVVIDGPCAKTSEVFRHFDGSPRAPNCATGLGRRI